MIDKKVVIGIVIFIVSGLFIFSFANPLEQREENQDSFTPTAPVQNQEDKQEEKEEETETRDEEKNESEEMNSQTTSDSSDYAYSNSTYKNTSASSSNTTSGTNNSGSNTTSGSNSSSGNSNSGNSSNSSENSGTASDSSGNNGGNSNSSSGNNGGNTENNNPTPTPDPTPIVRPTVATFGVAQDESANVQVIKNGGSITYRGEMNEKLPLVSNGREYKDYINIMVTSPDQLSQEEFNNLKLIYRGTTYGSSEFYLDSTTGKAYFYLLQPFNRSNDGSGGLNLTTIGFDVYWGYGESIHYNVTFDITVN